MSLNPQRAHDRKLKQLHASPRRARCKGVISTAGSGSRVKLDYIVLCRITDGPSWTDAATLWVNATVPSSAQRVSSTFIQVFVEIWHRPSPNFAALRELLGTRIDGGSGVVPQLYQHEALSSCPGSHWTVSPPHQGEFIWASVALRVHPTLFLFFFFLLFLCFCIHLYRPQ